MSQDRSYCYVPLYHYKMWRNIFIPHLKYCNKFGGGIMLISHALKNIDVFFSDTQYYHYYRFNTQKNFSVFNLYCYSVTTCTELCIAFLLFVSRSRIVPNNSAQRLSAAVPSDSICRQIRQSVGHSSLNRFSSELLQCFVFPFPIPRYCEKNQPKCLSVSG